MGSLSRRALIRAAAAAPFCLQRALAAEPEKRVALLIASGKFPRTADVIPLEGVANDVGMIAHLLEHTYGFARHNIWILGLDESEQKRAELERGYRFLDARATSDAMTHAIKDLIAVLSVGSFGVLYYAGHGAAIHDDARPRPKQETQYWIAADARPFFDFQMELLTAKVAGYLALVFDCCHAGGMGRNGNRREEDFVVVRAGHLPEAEVREILQSWAARRPSPRLEYLHQGNRTLFYAANVGEAAVELQFPHSGEPVWIGAFTWCLYQVTLPAGNLTYGEVLGRVSKRLQRFGNVLDIRPPNPDVSDNYQRLFIAPRVEGLPLTSDGSPQLNAGWLYGIRPQAILTGTGGASAIVDRVGRYASTLRLLSGSPLALRTGRLTFQPYVTAPPVGRHTYIRGDGPVLENGIQFFIDEKAGRYSVKSKLLGSQRPLAVADGLATRQDAEEKRDAILQGMRTANQIRNTLLVGFLPDDPFLLRLSTPESERGEAYPRYVVGAGEEGARPFNLNVRSRRKGYLLLLSCEPDGAINILYPNWSGWNDRAPQEERERITAAAYRLYRHDGSVVYPMAATLPYGLNTLIVVLLDTQITLPRHLLVPPQDREQWIHHIIPSRNVAAFLDWLGETMARLPIPDTDEDRGRGSGVPAGVSPHQIEEGNLIAMDRVAVEQFTYLSIPPSAAVAVEPGGAVGRV